MPPGARPTLCTFSHATRASSFLQSVCVRLIAEIHLASPSASFASTFSAVLGSVSFFCFVMSRCSQAETLTLLLNVRQHKECVPSYPGGDRRVSWILVPMMPIISVRSSRCSAGRLKHLTAQMSVARQLCRTTLRRNAVRSAFRAFCIPLPRRPRTDAAIPSSSPIAEERSSWPAGSLCWQASELQVIM